MAKFKIEFDTLGELNRKLDDISKAESIRHTIQADALSKAEIDFDVIDLTTSFYRKIASIDMGFLTREEAAKVKHINCTTNMTTKAFLETIGFDSDVLDIVFPTETTE